MYRIVIFSISFLIFLNITITCSPPDEDQVILPLIAGSIKSIREKTYYSNQAVQEISQIFYHNGERLVSVNNSISSLVFFITKTK